MEIFIFDPDRLISAIIATYKFTQRHSREGCLFSPEKTCDQILKNQEKVT